MENHPAQKDSAAWIFQTWASFILAVGTTVTGISYLPVDPWIRGFMGMGLLFTVGSSFTLAKTLRDQAESRRVHSVIQTAKVEQILAKHPLS